MAQVELLQLFQPADLCQQPSVEVVRRRLSTLRFLARETVEGTVPVRPGLEMSTSCSRGESLLKGEGGSETEVVPLGKQLERERVLRKGKLRRGPGRSFASGLQHGAVPGPIHFLIVCASQVW